MVYLNGFRVFINPALDCVPKMQLTQKVYDNLPAPFRDEINTWLREFFGTEPHIMQYGDGAIAMGPKMLEQVKANAR